MQNLLARLREWWHNTPRATRTGMLVGAGGLLVLFVALGFWATSPNYTVLYTGLSPADSAQVVQALKEKNIPVRTSGGGSVIEVPAEHAETARLELAAQGLPKTGAPGYARLEKTPFGMTQTMEQNTLRIAMEEELQNTIQHLEPVESARVHITPGNDSPFADSRTEPTASVVVTLKPGMQLTRDQVRGIVHLVSHSVEGLKPENVTVLDSEARPLWSGGDDFASDQEIVRARREAERAYADELRRQIQQHLDRVLGKDKSSVVVQAELNLDKQEIQSQRVEPLDPNRAAVVSETRTNERLNGAPPAAGGAAGIASNRAEAPMYPAAPTTAGVGEYNREDSVRNYEINKQVEHIVRAPGRIERLSVAVLVDESVPENAVTAMRAWLETAVGASPNTPNRIVTVQRVKFDTSAAKAAEEERKAQEAARRMATLWKLLPVLLLFIVTFFLARVIGKQIKRPTPSLPAQRPVAALPGGGTLDVSIGEEGIVALHSEGAPSEGGALTPIRRRGEEESFLEEEMARAIRERTQPELLEIQKFAQNKPEHVAALLKNWIKG
ncbi:flagellar M-ring protein FliF [Armatimonadetes bacterium GBS]|jgi:flagellar M-ring protein FliF|nr:Flagellar M-ring protein [bacterium HR14]CUU00589.1 flagellar M-ring protein FliF [Armatimonadetes bacterium GBS]CUU34847.1 flagellar M-ring protein FliF [Armatimonadetes bacterium GXS]